MKRQGNLRLHKGHISPETDCKDVEMDEISDKSFKRMITNKSMNTEKQLIELRK